MGPTCSEKIRSEVYAFRAWKQLDTWATLRGRKSYAVRSRSTVTESGVEPTHSGFALSFQSTFMLRCSTFGQESKGRITTPVNEEEKRMGRLRVGRGLDGREMI